MCEGFPRGRPGRRFQVLGGYEGGRGRLQRIPPNAEGPQHMGAAGDPVLPARLAQESSASSDPGSSGADKGQGSWAYSWDMFFSISSIASQEIQKGPRTPTNPPCPPQLSSHPQASLPGIGAPAGQSCIACLFKAVGYSRRTGLGTQKYQIPRGPTGYESKSLPHVQR